LVKAGAAKADPDSDPDPDIKAIIEMKDVGWSASSPERQ
jgi:hypothetical protein